jgi:hypothetical protein
VLRVVLLTLLLLPLPAAAAEIYRCINDDGVVSYTDNSDDCPEAEATGIDSARTDRAALAAQEQAAAERREERAATRLIARHAAEDEATDDAIRQENCQTQRDWLQQLMNTSRMFTTDADTGERTMLNTEQRNAKLQDARDRVADACG